MTEVPDWLILATIGAALAVGGVFAHFAMGTSRIQNKRDSLLNESLASAEAKILQLDRDLTRLEDTVRRLREDLSWERDQNRELRKEVARLHNPHLETVVIGGVSS